MICTYRHGTHTYEFDAKNRADENRKVREWAKEHGWKFENVKREQ